MKSAWRADPLVWGHGPGVFEVFLEPTCPFSAKAFGKLDDLLGKAGEDQITIKLRLQSQPWHIDRVREQRGQKRTSSGDGTAPPRCRLSDTIRPSFRTSCRRRTLV